MDAQPRNGTSSLLTSFNALGIRGTKGLLYQKGPQVVDPGMTCHVARAVLRNVFVLKMRGPGIW
jgi:hypothetical protein